MTLLEYVRHCQRLLDEHGPDLEVEKWLPSMGRHTAPAPVLAYRRVYPARRLGEAQVPQFYNHNDNEVQKGEPVIRV